MTSFWKLECLLPNSVRKNKEKTSKDLAYIHNLKRIQLWGIVTF